MALPRVSPRPLAGLALLLCMAASLGCAARLPRMLWECASQECRAGGNTLNVSSSQACPANPLELCDFFVEGFLNGVPLLSIPAEGDRHILSGPVRDSNRAADDPKGVVSVECVFQPRFLCPAPPGTASDGTNGDLCGVFYVSDDGNEGAKVKARHLDSIDRAGVGSRCVVVDLDRVQVNPKDQDWSITLDHGDDNNSLYPKNRRCVVFQTGPTPPVCDYTPTAPPPPVYEPTTPPPPVYQQSSESSISSESSVSALTGSAPCELQCPSSATDLCDFYFTGYKKTVPELQITGRNNDEVVSPTIEYNGTVIEVDSSGKGKTLSCPSQSTGDFFYSNEQQAVVKVRNVANGLSKLAGQCVLLPLESAQILLQDTNSTINLNKGDWYTDTFLYQRRCVVFRTK